jgi:S-DNA-T family DNA segregation ATPase FtsK/SpoIIIE
LQTQTKFVPEKAKKAYSGEVNENIVEAERNQNHQISIDDPIVRKPKQMRIPKPYKRPPLDLLTKYDSQVNRNEDALRANAENIVNTLREFKIDTEVLDIIQGPTFTSDEMKMKPGISVNTIFSKENDLKMVLRNNKIRLQVPIPGKNAFGIEVPNEKRSMVGLRDILESPEFQNSTSPLTVALGKDITNTCKVHQIDKMVHTLVAGGTNSGKSVCLHTLLISLLYKASPDELKLLLVDPKRVEFNFYNDLPHMLIPKAINDVERAIDALEWLVKEMERRYTKLQSIYARNIIMYNNSPEVKSGQLEKMYYIVMVFDEVGDFMSQAKKEIEDSVKRLAAMARACGIHLILTTQKPTQEVITGPIKTNLPSRIAFAVTANVDSRVILDKSGAETLLGKGDMLFQPQGASEPERMQCAFVDDNVDLQRVLNYIKDNNEAIFDETIEDEMFNKKDGFDPTNGAEDATDPLLKDVIKLMIKTNRTAAGYIQTWFSIGWPRASKIMMQLEKLGYISTPDNKKNRKIFMTVQDFEEKFGESIDD